MLLTGYECLKAHYEETREKKVHRRCGCDSDSVIDIVFILFRECSVFSSMSDVLVSLFRFRVAVVTLSVTDATVQSRIL